VSFGRRLSESCEKGFGKISNIVAIPQKSKSIFGTYLFSEAVF